MPPNPNPTPVPPGTQEWATAPVPDTAGWTAVPPPPTPPPAQRRGRGPLVVAIVLAVVLLCGGGGGLAAYLLLRDPETGEGAAEPVAAVEGFLDAVYVDQNAAAATGLLCREARDQRAVQDKIDEVRQYARTYPSPRYRWDPPKVEEQDAEKAIVSTRLTVLTADDRSAEEQLRFTLVHKTGWWVCDVG
ncbi:hypothetical protein AB0J82_24020 [Asanoa sp. NPDC049518]|uniref:Rv0361 family membrane protein n=1 Tax=unclassified Asanoa TaxID=2685164 RepID=UPI0034138F19